MKIEKFIDLWNKSSQYIRTDVIEELGIYPLDESDKIYFEKQMRMKTFDRMGDFMKNSIMWKLPTKDIEYNNFGIEEEKC